MSGSDPSGESVPAGGELEQPCHTIRSDERIPATIDLDRHHRAGQCGTQSPVSRRLRGHARAHLLYLQPRAGTGQYRPCAQSSEYDDASLLHVPSFLRHLYWLTDRLQERPDPIPFLNAFAHPAVPRRRWPLVFEPAVPHTSLPVAFLSDAARASLLALDGHEWTCAVPALVLARQWLRFVEYMLEPDGRFAVSIADRRGTKLYAEARDHALPAACALWALARAWRVMADDRYIQHIRRAHWMVTDDMKALAVQALALLELYAVEPSGELRDAICDRCERICASGPDYFRDQPDQPAVALSGYYQLLAVARAGQRFSRLDFLRACESTVISLVEPVIAQGFFHVYPCASDPQCASDIAPLAQGLEQLQRVMRRQRYRALASQCIDWLDGNNPAASAVYDRSLGRCADAVQEGEISPFCGADAAIAAGFMELSRSRLHD